MALPRRSFNACAATTTTYRQNETITSLSAHPSSLRTPDGGDFGARCGSLPPLAGGTWAVITTNVTISNTTLTQVRWASQSSRLLTLDHA